VTGSSKNPGHQIVLKKAEKCVFFTFSNLNNSMTVEYFHFRSKASCRARWDLDFEYLIITVA